MSAFDLSSFSRENRSRCESPRGFNHALGSWSLSDWMTAAMGELGEAANVAKKLNRDAFELLSRIDDADGMAIYCDPPYLVKGASYVHDFEAADHARLAEALARFRRARVVVSYYEHPRLAELYPAGRWSMRRHEVNRAMASQGGKLGGDRATEVLLVNEPGGESLFERMEVALGRAE